MLSNKMNIEHLNECAYAIGLQGVVTVASMAFFLYKLKTKKCACELKSEKYFSPLNSYPQTFENTDIRSFKSVTNRVKLPKRKVPNLIHDYYFRKHLNKEEADQ